LSDDIAIADLAADIEKAREDDKVEITENVLTSLFDIVKEELDKLVFYTENNALFKEAISIKISLIKQAIQTVREGPPLTEKEKEDVDKMQDIFA
jgi:hypothetical protein